MTFQRTKEWICESNHKQVSDRLHVFAVFILPLNPSRLQFMFGLYFTPSQQSLFRGMPVALPQ